MFNHRAPNLSIDEIVTFLQNTPVGLIFFSSEWEIKFLNDNISHFNILKNTSEYYQNKNIFESGLASELNLAENLIGIKEDKFIEKEICNISTIDGGEISVIIKVVSLSGNDSFLGGIIVLEDIKITAESKKFNFEQKEFFENVFKSLYDVILIADKDSIVIQQIPEKNKLCKSNPIGLELEHFFKTSGFYNYENILNEFNSIHKKQNGKIYLKSDDEDFIYKVSFVPLTFGSKVHFTFIAFKNVTMKVQEENKIQAELSELRQYQVITSAVTDAVITTDLSGNITFWNKSAENLFHYSRSQVYGKPIGKIIRTFTKKTFESILEEIEDGNFWESELKIINNNLEEYVSVKISLSEEGQNKSVIILCSSITERMKIERELRISEERFRNIVLNANELICNLDLDGNIIFVNPRFIKAFEFTEGELMGMNIEELLEPEQKLKGNFTFNKLINDEVKSFELSFVSKSGRVFFTLANFSPILNLDNTPRYFNGIFTDITEKKEAEKILLMIRSVYEASRDGISIETGRKFILVNDSFANMFGYNDASELIGKDPLDLIANKDIPKIAKYIQERESRTETANQFEYLGKRKDDSIFCVETSVSSYEFENRIYIVAVCRDITERKRSQEALKDSEEKYRSITENIDDFLWTAERSGDRLRPVFYTATIEKITGYKQEEFIGDSKLWFKIVYPDDSLLMKKKLRLLFTDAARFSDEIEFRIINRNGNVVWVRNKISVKRNGEGKPIKVFGLVSDITLNKKAEEELRKSAESLKELNQTKDRFISIISHDLRTPFSSILGFTDILLSDKSIPETQRLQYVKYIGDSSRNMLALVNSLLDWARLQTGHVKFEPERTDANEIVDKSMTIVAGAAMKKNISISSDIDKGIFIHADSSLILQVINNLLSNAVKFTNEDGNIIISAKTSIELNQTEFVIKDSGIGIRKEDLDKLFKFDSKFTTKGTSGERGTGLGLSLVKEIIEKHGGRIWVESEYGNGSEFHFTIPIASADILLVDDNKTDRFLYSKIFKNITPNYRIIVADNGQEAFDILVKSSPALLVTDHNMPVMGGYDLVKKIKVSDLKRKPPVIILSADITKSISEAYREIGVEYIFQKPVNLSIFKEAVEKSLKKALLD